MKLNTKLLFAFISIVLLMGLTQSIFLQSKIKSTFEDYLEQQNTGSMKRMKQNLELYYKRTGSWENVQERYFSQTGMGKRAWDDADSTMNMHMSSADLILLDTNKTVIADTSGNRIGENGTSIGGKTSDLTIDGQKVGTLLLYQHELQNLEKGFILSSNLAIIGSGLMVAIIALLLSIWITRKITHPLKQLVIGTKQIARGDKLGTHSHYNKR